MRMRGGPRIERRVALAIDRAARALDNARCLFSMAVAVMEWNREQRAELASQRAALDEAFPAQLAGRRQAMRAPTMHAGELPRA